MAYGMLRYWNVFVTLMEVTYKNFSVFSGIKFNITITNDEYL